MKKIFGFLILSLLLNVSAGADINAFNKWLYDNGHYELVEKIENEKCKSFVKGDINWNNNNCDYLDFYKNKFEIYIYPSNNSIPEGNAIPKPNYITLAYEFFRYSIYDKPKVMKYSINPSKTPYKFQSNLIEDKYIDQQLNKSGLLSYLYFENSEIKIDKISPKNRFGKFIDDKTKFKSQSVGKTMVSYVVGHAICEGYIESVDAKINDWPLIENTLYHNQKLIDLLNFRAGDQKYVWDYFFINPKVFKDGLGNVNRNIELLINYEFKNSIKSNAKFNYSSFLANLLLNYVVFKTDENFEKLLEKIFKEKVKIQNEVFFKKVGGSKLQGNADNMFYASRYDYLRIAKAMLDDWQNDTCVGKYLKQIFERKETKGNQRKPINFPYARSYAGMFQTNYENIPNKRPVMGMHGYGGQHVVIDFENSRIIVANSVYENWDWKRIVYSKIRKGID